MKMKSSTAVGLTVCAQIVLIMLFNLICGMMSVNYILGWFGKNIPWVGDMVIGLFVAEISVPVAVIGWVLKLFGVF